SNPVSGTSLPVGTTTVTNTATDDSGNITNVTFMVTVNDVEAPSANVPSAVVTNNFASDHCGTYVFFTLPPQTDNCAVSNEVANPSSGSSFPVGATPVTVIVTDIHGNTATNSFTVTVNDTAPPNVTCPGNQTNVANAETAMAQLPDLTSQVIATDPCGGNLTLTQIPPPGTTVGLGVTGVTVWAGDQNGNSNYCTTTVTVIYTNAPTIVSCAPDATVSVTQDREPYATGHPVFSDPDVPLTITYSDDVSGLTNHDVTGTILRTWTAVDASSNAATCAQTITVVDTNAPYFTYVPADISTSNDLNECGAEVNYGGAALDLGYFQGFENTNWAFNTNSANTDWDWNAYYSFGTSLSTMYRVPSGTNGIVSPNGVAYAVIDSSASAPLNYASNGVYTAFGGGIMPFESGYKMALDVYINFSDPQVMNATPANGYGFDLDADPQAYPGGGYGAQDFIFHVAAYSPTGIVVAADNNSVDRGDQRPGNLLAYADYGMITNSGWYKFAWTFRNTNGLLAVDMVVYSVSNRAALFSETISNTAAVANIAGDPNYLWFGFIDDNELPVADASYQRIIPVLSNPVSGTSLPVGTTTVTNTATDDSGNITNVTFMVTVNDVEAP
ncbi:MAG: HYR domain-containing protein, partial [Limisphaerales bacterium]